MKKPFFSIIIPTYKRSAFLKAEIDIFLQQTFTDFEIVVVDDCSPDDTKEIVSSIQDKRVRYIRNSRNLGQEGNFKRAFSLGAGKYIFISGNDDFILWPDTLEKVHQILITHKYGFVRLNLIEKKFIGKGLRKSIINYEQDIIIPKHSEAKDILDFFRKVAVGHMAGLIFINSPRLGAKIFHLQETPWIKILFEATYNFGAAFLSREYMIITWSQMSIFTHYKVSPGKPIFMEEYLKYILGLLPQTERSLYKLNYFKIFAILQPAIKLYSGNSNLVKFNKRLFTLEPRLQHNFLLWIFFFLTILTPTFVLKFIRIVQHRHRDTFDRLPNCSDISTRFLLLNKKYYER
jgi:glycosyltransferase involved in cell wall biosynthesis